MKSCTKSNGSEQFWIGKWGCPPCPEAPGRGCYSQSCEDLWRKVNLRWLRFTSSMGIATWTKAEQQGNGQGSTPSPSQTSPRWSVSDNPSSTPIPNSVFLSADTTRRLWRDSSGVGSSPKALVSTQPLLTDCMDSRKAPPTSSVISKLGSGNVITPEKWAGFKHNQLPKHWWVQHYGKCVLALISCSPLGQLHGNGANHSWRNAGVSPQVTLSNGWNKIQYAIKVKAFLSWAIPCPAEHRHWISPVLFPTESCINGTLTPREVILTV